MLYVDLKGREGTQLIYCPVLLKQSPLVKLSPSNKTEVLVSTHL
jgi:hypothetical protein